MTMYYQNRDKFNDADMEVVFYEVFRRHTGNGRDNGVTFDFLVGTADTFERAQECVNKLNQLKDIVMEAAEKCQYVGNQMYGKEAFYEALSSIQKYDRTFYAGESPKYHLVPILKAKSVNLDD